MEMSSVKYYDPLLERFKEKSRQRHRTVDYQCLQKYNQRNTHFSMEVITIKEEKQERFVGYNCIYRYGIHEVKLEYSISTAMWTIVSDKYHAEEEKQLNIYMERINKFSWVDIGYPLDERIQDILRSFDGYFLKLDQPKETEQNNETMSKSLSVSEKENDSACSTQSSVQSPLFIPPSPSPVRRRRVIEFILLHVQQKRKTLEKIVDVLKCREPPKMYELGSEFLRVYDGKFNYPEGHILVMSFRKKTWFLTIEQIKYIDCPVSEIGPRSVLMLHFKGQYARVLV